MPYRLAIVEDNATARSALRSHLLPAGDFEISSFSNGNELKAALRRQHFEIIFMDFHLGQDKNGVEWIKLLRQGQYIRPSTGIIFITADRLPQTIGKIIDIQPDLLIIKPYNIATLRKNIAHYLHYRQFVGEVLTVLDNQQPSEALTMVEALSKKAMPSKIKSDVLKLHARLLFDNGKIRQAQQLYDSVLQNAAGVLWAQWGKIKCEYLAGNWSHCKNELTELVNNNLARDKAFEWLACLCFEQEAWSQAEFYLDHIKISDLSVPAARLKSLTYQKQNKIVDGLELLQKKRDYNRSARERFNEFTFELAEFYLSIAEHQPKANRWESLNQAKRLVGIAGRGQADQQLLQKKDYLLSYASVLEGDSDRAEHYLAQDHMEMLLRTDPATLIIAAKTFNGMGRKSKAKELLAMAHERNQNDMDLSAQTMNENRLTVAEKTMGVAEDRAIDLNETGTKLFVTGQYVQAMYYFYQAYRLMFTTSAFGLNLLQCMLESRHPSYRTFTVATLIKKIQSCDLSARNQARLDHLIALAEKDTDYFLSVTPINRAFFQKVTASGNQI
ncbi:response regulator [Alteromonas sp. C1M14]|uniref:response regulator n=1 Tax=Alteromonas sp. C1M14 TaxID=2841567 RepID=UPI001C08A3B1|nr:response regulator [Alteromonas sp. C1M14]MBU2976949.1 response regulator [Alteromonas sp. C1M14]